MQGYVAGFAFSPDGENVALLTKARPEWQAGLMNGIGGKIEPGELPIDAMVREFQEETGELVYKEQWEHRVTFVLPLAVLYFYTCTTNLMRLQNPDKTEPISIISWRKELYDYDTMYNLKWLIPLMHSTVSFPITLHDESMPYKDRIGKSKKGWN